MHGVLAGHRADNYVAVRQLRAQGQVLANHDPVDAGWNRLEKAAVLFIRLGLRIPCFELAHTAGAPEQNH